MCVPLRQGLSRRTPSSGTGRPDEAKQRHAVRGQELTAWRLSRRLPRVGPAQRVVAAVPAARVAPDAARRAAACRCGEGVCMYHPPGSETQPRGGVFARCPRHFRRPVTVSGRWRWSLITGQTEAVDTIMVRWLGQNCMAVATAKSPERRKFTGAGEPLSATRFLENSRIQRTTV